MPAYQVNYKYPNKEGDVRNGQKRIVAKDAETAQKVAEDHLKLSKPDAKIISVTPW